MYYGLNEASIVACRHCGSHDTENIMIESMRWVKGQGLVNIPETRRHVFHCRTCGGNTPYAEN